MRQIILGLSGESILNNLDGLIALTKKHRTEWDKAVKEALSELTVEEPAVFDGSKGCWYWNHPVNDAVWKSAQYETSHCMVEDGTGHQTEQQCTDAHNKDLLLKRYTDYWEKTGGKRVEGARGGFYVTPRHTLGCTIDYEPFIPRLACFTTEQAAKDCLETFTQEEINIVCGWD